jgi:hypothetical protein
MAKQAPSGCLVAIFRIFGAGNESASTEQTLPYKRKEFLLSRSEVSFYGVLNQIAGSDYLNFAKIRLADVIYIQRGTRSRRAAMNRIQSKHLDFLLCHRNGVRPCLAIELDDRSHEEPDRVARDHFVRQALSAAQLPLLQIKAANNYSSQQLKNSIAAAIHSEKR